MFTINVSNFKIGVSQISLSRGQQRNAKLTGKLIGHPIFIHTYIYIYIYIYMPFCGRKHKELFCWPKKATQPLMELQLPSPLFSFYYKNHAGYATML